MRYHLVAAVIGLSISSTAILAQPAPQFTITDLGTLGGTLSTPMTISKKGHVIGFSNTTAGAEHAFIWAPQTGMIDLGALQGASNRSDPVGINDRDEVVGESYVPYPHAFFWTAKTGMMDLGVGTLKSAASAINNRGEVIGISNDGLGNLHSFLWTLESGVKDLGAIFASAINDRGEIAGGNSAGHAFILVPGKNITDLGTLGGVSSGAVAINDRGQVIGSSQTFAGDRHAFLWTNKSGMIDLGTIGGNCGVDGIGSINDRGEIVGTCGDQPGVIQPFRWTAKTGMVGLGGFGGVVGYGRGINQRGEVVGVSSTASSAFLRAFYWTAQIGMLDLSTAVIGLPPGVVISEPISINDRGQITATAFTSSSWHAIVLTPVEPGNSRRD